MPIPTQAFKSWLKSNPNTRLSSDASVTHIASEGITTFVLLIDLDMKSIKYLPGTCKLSISAIEADDLKNVEAESAVNRANISRIYVRRLIDAFEDAKFYDAVGRIMTPQSMNWGNVLTDFKV